MYIFKYCSIFFPALFKFSNTGRPLQLQEQPARNLHSTTARRFCTGHIPGLQCWTFSFEYCRLYPAAMTDKEHLCDLHDDNDFKETKWPRGVGRHPTKRRAKGRANFQASDRAQAGSTEHSDTEQTMENKRKPTTKHNWIACKDDAGVGPRIFQGFAAAFAYMHLTFAVVGCEGMALVDKGGDTTKHSVVYRYACAFHNYIRCPFVVRIRVLVCSLTTSRTVCFFLFQTNCQSHTPLCHMW
jgi:hypothetical protein